MSELSRKGSVHASGRRFVVVSRYDHAWGGNKHYVHDYERGVTLDQEYTSAAVAARDADALEREASDA